MATLTKTKKNSLSVKERLSALQEQLRHENNSPVTLPDRKEPVEEPINTPPIGISEEKEEDILLEEKNRIKTLPENQKTGIDNLNLPRLPITEEEKKSLSPKMLEFAQEAEGKIKPVSEETEPVLEESGLSQKEKALKDIGMTDLTGTGQKLEEIKIEPPSIKDKIQSLKERLQKEEKENYGTISFGRLSGVRDYTLATATIMNKVIAGGLDLPYDFVMGFANQVLHGTGLDKQIGTVKLGAVSEIFRSYGLTFSPEMEKEIELNHPQLTAIAEFMGFSLAAGPVEAALGIKYMSRPVYTALQKRFPGEPSFDVAITKLLNKLPFLKKAKISPYAPKTREALKKGIGEIGETLVRSPFKTLSRDMIISGSAGSGYQFFSELSDNDPWVSFIGSMGTALTFSGTIKLLEMGGSLTYSVIKSLAGIKGTGAELRAAGRLESIGGANIRNELEELVRRVENPNGEEYLILQEVWDAMSPGQKAGASRNLLGLEKTILSYDTSLAKAGDEQFQSMQNMLFKAFTLAGNNRSSIKSRTFQKKGAEPLSYEFFRGGDVVGDIAFTREYYSTQMKYFDAILDARLLIAARNYENGIKNLKPTDTKEKSSEIARQELNAAYKDMRDTETAIWKAAELDKEVSVMPIVNVWKDLLKSRSRATDREQLKFSAPSEDRERLILELGEFKDGVWVPGIAEAENNGNISLQVLQDIRTRVLDELKNMTTRPSETKQRIFNSVQDAIMNTFKTEEAKIHFKQDPETGEFLPEIENIKDIFTAISFSKRLHDKYRDGIIAEILAPTSKSRTGLDPRLTFELLLRPTSSEGKFINVEKLLEAVKSETDPKIKRLIKTSGKKQDDLTVTTDALTSYLKHKFLHEFLSPDKTKLLNTEGASKWVTEHRSLLNLIPEFRTEIKEAILTGNVLKLRKSKTERAKEYLYNTDKNLLVLMLRTEPEKIFNWESGTPYIKNIPVSDISGVSKVMRKIAFKASKDPTGSAILGLQQSVFQWLLRRSLVTENEINVLSGAKLTHLLNEEKTKVIVSTFLTEEQKAKLRVFQITANELDAIRTASPLIDKKGTIQSISGDTTGWILDFVGKVMGADLGRRFQRNFLGGGTIQTPGAFSKQMRLILKDLDIDLAEKLLIEAFTSENPRDFSILLRKIDTQESAQVFDRYINSFFVTLTTKYNLPFPYIDDLGTIEGEEQLGIEPKKENDPDITLELEKKAP